MKFHHYLTVLSALMLAPFTVSAQTSQKGIVKEYREENNKRPLPGVEVEITNAGSVVSDKKGDFLLEFRTFKPGQKVNVRRIEKSGYEIFNKEALEQWNINPEEPFTIVMVKQELFKEIRDNYSRISSKSYAEQYEKEKAALDKERQEGRLSEERHAEELQRLSAWYDAQLENLDNYVDRFARIDLAELDKDELVVIELVKEGKLDEAIARYEEFMFIDAFESETAELLQITEGIKALNDVKRQKALSVQAHWEKIQRELDLNVLKGGQESYAKVTDILLRAVKADPGNLYVVSECISYAAYINHIALQKSLCELCDIENIADEDYRLAISRAYCSALQILGEYEKAAPYAEYVLELARRNNDAELRYKGLSLLLTIYEYTMQSEKMIAVFSEMIGMHEDENLYSKLSDKYKAALAHDISAMYEKMGDYVNSNRYLLISYQLCTEIVKADPILDNLRRFVNIAVSLGTSYYYLGDADNSMKYLEVAQSLIEDAGMTQNPAFAYEYYASLKQRGIVYFELGDYVNSEILLASALQIVESVNADLFIVEEKTDMYNNLGYLYFTTEQYEKSEKMYKTAMDVCYGPYVENPNKYIFNIFRVQINMSSLYLAMESYENALAYGKDAALNCEMIYAAYPDLIIDNYVLVLQNMAQAASALGNKEYASELLAKALEIKPDDAVTIGLKNSL